MPRRIPVALVLVALGAIIAYPSTSTAIPPIGQKDNGFSKTEEVYLHTYVHCWHAFKAKCGRNIVDDGLSNGKAASETQAKDSTATMERWLNPPTPAPVATSVSEGVAPAPEPTTTSVAPAPVSSGGCPSYMAGEASSPSAVNASSGASGCFQVLGSTAAAMGPACADVNATSCVAAICAAQGNAAWAASGSTPCDYIRP